MNALLARVRRWLRLSPDLSADYYQLDAIAGRTLDDYESAVVDGAPRGRLADILIGLAGCELVMSYTVGIVTPDGGLLLQEVAFAAAEGKAYRGVRCRELSSTPISEALWSLAVAYEVEDNALIGRRLDEVRRRAVDVVGGDATECLVPLIAAHGYKPEAAHPGGDSDE